MLLLLAVYVHVDIYFITTPSIIKLIKIDRSAMHAWSLYITYASTQILQYSRVS